MIAEDVDFVISQREAWFLLELLSEVRTYHHLDCLADFMDSELDELQEDLMQAAYFTMACQIDEELHDADQ